MTAWWGQPKENDVSTNSQMSPHSLAFCMLTSMTGWVLQLHEERHGSVNRHGLSLLENPAGVENEHRAEGSQDGDIRMCAGYMHT